MNRDNMDDNYNNSTITEDNNNVDGGGSVNHHNTNHNALLEHNDLMYKHQLQEYCPQQQPEQQQLHHHRIVVNDTILICNNDQQQLFVPDDNHNILSDDDTTTKYVTIPSDTELLMTRSSSNILRQRESTTNNNKKSTTIHDIDNKIHDKMNGGGGFIHQNLNDLVERRAGPGGGGGNANITLLTEDMDTIGNNEQISSTVYNRNHNTQDVEEAASLMIPIAAEVVVDVYVDNNSLQQQKDIPQLVVGTLVRRERKTNVVMMSIGGLILLISIIALVIYFTMNNKSNSNAVVSYNSTDSFGVNDGMGDNNMTIPSNSPSSSPTFYSTEWDINWFQLGSDIKGGYSQDAAGTSIAVSRNGLSVVIGAPGDDSEYDTGGYVYVFKYNVSTWEKLALIDKSYPYDNTGLSVAVDDAGKIVAVGSPFQSEIYDPNITKHPGTVRIYMINMTIPKDPYNDWGDNNRYEQIGYNITGYKDDDEFGWTIDLNNDGDIIAVGARFGCYVQTFQYSSSVDDWIEYGQTINCTGIYDSYYSIDLSVHISGDGSTIIVGEPNAMKDLQDEGLSCGPIGQVTVYRFDGTNNRWIQIGKSIQGNECKAEFGYSTAISDNGQIIASCSPKSNVGRTSQQTVDSNLDPWIGSCHIYYYNDTISSWQQLGNNLTGSDLFDTFGWSVSLNAAGNVIAIGAARSNVNGDDSGYVRVLEYNEFNQLWVMIGDDIAGPYGYAEAGYSVALSAIGDKVTIGAPNTNLPDSDRSGNVLVYETGAMFIEGPINITVSLFTSLESYGISWFIDRMDVQRYDNVYIMGDLNGYPTTDYNTTKTITAMVPYGVYRIIADLSNTYADIYVNDQLIESVENQTQLTFIANLPSSDEDSTSDMTTIPYNTSMILSIDFDDRPFDIHWVVVLYDNMIDTNDNNDNNNDNNTIIQRHRSIVAFGPQSIYGSELMNQKYNETIYITYHSDENSEIILIINDDGRDGLCCNHGNGSIRLYNHNQSNIIFENKINDTSRFIHRFSIKELLN